MSEQNVRYDGLRSQIFDELTTLTLTRSHLLRLLAGTVGAIRIPGAIPGGLCDAFMRRLDPSLFTSYSAERYEFPVQRVGPALNEFNTERTVPEGYWARAREALSYWDSLESPHDVRATVIQLLSSAWRDEVRPATVGQRQLFWGIVREMNDGALAHWDDVVREYSDELFDDPPIVQLALNCFVSTPREGGETTVWRKRWDPADDIYRRSVCYDHDVVTARPFVSIKPHLGDIMIFDSRNYHAVQESSNGRRVSISIFIGLTGRGHLLVWS